jgi:hypothetical protein
MTQGSMVTSDPQSIQDSRSGPGKCVPDFGIIAGIKDISLQDKWSCPTIKDTVFSIKKSGHL